MLCKKCGTEIEDGDFCPECGTRVITTKFKLTRILFAVAIIGISIVFGIYGDNQILGYSLINIFYTIILILLGIIVVKWIYEKKRPQTKSTIKQDFKNLTTDLKGINKLSDNYKNLILIGYLSIILLFISLFLKVISIHLFGGLNENQLAGWLTIINLILAILFYFYYFISISLKLRKISNKKPILNHFYIILLLFSIFIFISVNV